MLKCYICNIEKNRSNTMLRHLENDHPDLSDPTKEKKRLNQIKEIKYRNENRCHFCDLTFKRKDNLKYHIDNSCKQNLAGKVEKIMMNADIENFTRTFDKMVEMRSKYYPNEVVNVTPINQKVDKIENSNNTNTQIHVDGDNNNVNVQNVDNHVDNTIINNITHTNIEPLKDNIELYQEFKQRLGEIVGGTYHLSQKYDINKRNDAIIKLIEFINFNENYPENHNFYVPNRKLQDYVIFYKNKWNRTADTKEIDEVIDNIKDGFYKSIQKMIDDDKIGECEINLKKLKDGLDQKSTKEFFEKVFMKAYEHKDMIKDTRAKQEIEQAIIR